MCTAMTPAIYKAETALKMAKEIHPGAITILGGVYGTFMYGPVLNEAPWIDYVVRGEGEEIIVNLVRAIDRDEEGQIVATAANAPIKNLDALTPDWGILEWHKYIYIPMNTRVAVPSFARGCPFTCLFCSQWKFWRTYRSRNPINFVNEIETLVRGHKVGFFILANEEPTINKKKFVALCEELAKRKLPVTWASTPV